MTAPAAAPEREGSAPIAVEAAPAKVNLALHVTGRRADGYHLLDTLVVHGGWSDTVSATRATRDGAIASLTIDGPHAAGLSAGDDNLVLRAARLLAEEAARLGRPIFPVDLRLEKHLPVASGVGGGSSDAAATLRLLDRLWGLDLGRERLAALSLPLGADLPMCVIGAPLRARGIGDEIAPIASLPPFRLELANPGVPVSTPAVFKTLGCRENPSLPPLPDRFADVTALVAWLAATRNDLEGAAITIAPAIAETLAEMRARPGCLFARMSGSGATCFGIFAA